MGYLQALLSSEINLVLIKGNELFQASRWMICLPARIRAMFLQRKLLQYAIDEIYFAHDNSSDFWNQALMQAFPAAKRYCYGDALGLVYTHTYFNQLMYRLRHEGSILFYNFFARFKRFLLYPGKKRRLFAERAILAIPCDPGGDFLTSCSLSIIDQATFRAKVSALADCLPEFKKHMSEQIQAHPNCYLLMLSNFTESKLTTLANEIRLYQEILATYAQKDGLIIIKPHPAHQKSYLDQIVSALSKEYTIEVVDERFYHLPIELAETLVKGCTILSVSYSSISLPYLYNKEVIHVLTQDMIERYFLPEKRSWFRESNQLYLDMMRALPSWTKENELSL
jgi:hypothetical protein